MSVPLEDRKSFVMLGTHMRAKWFANHSRMARKPNLCMYGWDCEPVLRHLQTVRPFAMNQNLSVFDTNTKGTECAWCPVQCSLVENVKYYNEERKISKYHHTGKSAQICTFLSHCTFWAVVPNVIIIIKLYDFKWINLGAHWMIFVARLFNRSVTVMELNERTRSAR